MPVNQDGKKVLFKHLDSTEKVINILNEAIAEHQWEDALNILPIIASKFTTKPGVDNSFLWKSIVIVLQKNKVDEEKKFLFFLKLLNNIPTSVTLALNWLSEFLPKNEKGNLEAIFQKLREATTSSRNAGKFHFILCDCLEAIYRFNEWEKSFLESIGTKGVQDEDDEDIKMMKLKKNGMKIFQALLMSMSDLQNIQITTRNTGLKESMCDWIAAPILHFQEILKTLNLYDETENPGWDLFEQYMNDNAHHLPTIRLAYNFKKRFYPNDEAMIRKLLLLISDMCPEDRLVLETAKMLLRDKNDYEECNFESLLTDNCRCLEFQCEIRKLKTIKCSDENFLNHFPIAENCLLKSCNMESLTKCVSLLVHLLEFAQWRNNSSAWKLLKKVLLKFHISWLNCWTCAKCTVSRHYIKNLVDKLSLWPTLFWDADVIAKEKEMNSNKLIGVGYSAFIFGYDKNINVKEIVRTKLNCYPESQQEILDLTTDVGTNTNEFNLFLKSLQDEWTGELLVCSPSNKRRKLK